MATPVKNKLPYVWQNKRFQCCLSPESCWCISHNSEFHARTFFTALHATATMLRLYNIQLSFLSPVQKRLRLLRSTLKAYYFSQGGQLLEHWKGETSLYHSLTRSVLWGKKCTKFIFSRGLRPLQTPTGESHDVPHSS